MAADCLTESGGRLQLLVRVTPRSPRKTVEPPRDGRLIVRVNAPPSDGEANAAVRKLVGKFFGVPQSKVEIVRGQTSRDKTLALDGLSRAEAEAKIAELGR